MLLKYYPANGVVTAGKLVVAIAKVTGHKVFSSPEVSTSLNRLAYDGALLSLVVLLDNIYYLILNFNSFTP